MLKSQKYSSLDIQLLVAHILQKERVWVLAHPEMILSENERLQVEEALTKLEQGTPLAYLLGEREFYGLPFCVNKHVLVPRPETEHLVEYALHWLGRQQHPHNILEVGIGSGCIAISLAYHSPELHIVGIDLSWQALQLTRRNSQRHNVSHRISLLQSDLCSAITPNTSAGIFELICANLPYVPSLLAQQLPAEPQLALDGGEDGTTLLQKFIPQTKSLLRRTGLLLLEVGSAQGATIMNLCQAVFPEASVSLLADLAGLDRVCAVHLNGECL